MTRLLVLVEGQTEVMFVDNLLEPHLRTFGYIQVAPRLLGNARQRLRRGGISAWSSPRTDLEHQLRQDPDAVVALMVDYYGLPQTGPRAWPGRAASTGADAVEDALRECITRRYEALNDITATATTGKGSRRLAASGPATLNPAPATPVSGGNPRSRSGD